MTYVVFAFPLFLLGDKKKKAVLKVLFKSLNSRKVFRQKKIFTYLEENCRVHSKSPGTEEVNTQFSDGTTERA